MPSLRMSGGGLDGLALWEESPLLSGPTNLVQVDRAGNVSARFPIGGSPRHFAVSACPGLDSALSELRASLSRSVERIAQNDPGDGAVYAESPTYVLQFDPYYLVTNRITLEASVNNIGWYSRAHDVVARVNACLAQGVDR